MSPTHHPRESGCTIPHLRGVGLSCVQAACTIRRLAPGSSTSFRRAAVDTIGRTQAHGPGTRGMKTSKFPAAGIYEPVLLQQDAGERILNGQWHCAVTNRACSCHLPFPIPHQAGRQREAWRVLGGAVRLLLPGVTIRPTPIEKGLASARRTGRSARVSRTFLRGALPALPLLRPHIVDAPFIERRLLDSAGPRRATSDRRIQPRSGRRASDRPPLSHCLCCGSRDIEHVDTTRQGQLYQCIRCDHKMGPISQSVANR
jgi:hypothetical protein